MYTQEALQNITILCFILLMRSFVASLSEMVYLPALPCKFGQPVITRNCQLLLDFELIKLESSTPFNVCFVNDEHNDRTEAICSFLVIASFALPLAPSFSSCFFLYLSLIYNLALHHCLLPLHANQAMNLNELFAPLFNGIHFNINSSSAR